MSAAATPAPKRKPGRPKGSPKVPGSGRKKGAPNVVGRAARAYLAGASGYLDILARVCSGKSIRMAGPTGKVLWHRPDWADRKWALELIASKCIPTMSAAEVSGPEGEPLVPQYTNKEWARRIAHLLTRPDAEEETRAAAEAAEGCAGTAHVPGSAEGEDTAVGETPAPSGPSALAPSRSNGAANAAARGGGGPLSDPGASESTQHPVSGFENFSPKKAIPPTEPVEGQTARVAGYIVLCGPPQRPGLPLSYRITDSDGKLLAMATDGWQGALRWIKARVGDDADMSIDIIQPTPAHEPVRPDQRQFATGGPDIAVLRGHETERKL